MSAASAVEGTSTLPADFPEFTLGWGVIQHAATYLVQPNGPKAGQLWTPTLDQARFLLWWYAVDADGRWLFNHGVRRLAKGSGKSPFAAVMALEELVGPVRFKCFDASAKGGVIGRPVDMPLVQIAATAESQTANTMRMVRAMAQKRSRIAIEYGIDVGKTVFYTPEGGQLEVITSSASAAEGAEVTFAVMDETEHWTPTSGGQELAQTLDRNLAKSGSRAIETANAWEPDVGSVAETTFNAFQAQQEGRTRGRARMLYDSRVAPADVDVRSEDDVRRALRFVYEDCFWVDIDVIADRVHDLRTPEDVSRRYYFNQPTAAEDAWVTPMEWAALADPQRVVADGEDVVLFFDGSKSRDATALVGCCMSDGYVFTVGVWEPTPKHDTEDVIDPQVVDAAVVAAFEKYQVVAFFADVQEWQGFVQVTWPQRWEDNLRVWARPGIKQPQAIAWDMRSHKNEFAEAVETCEAEIVEGQFRHDGHPVTSRHVGNARRRPQNGRVSIAKESKDSPRKIDAAVCVVGARMVRRIVLAAAPKKQRTGVASFW